MHDLDRLLICDNISHPILESDWNDIETLFYFLAAVVKSAGKFIKADIWLKRETCL